MNYIFLDTNIFIHFKHFEDIDWSSIINKSSDITIVIAPTVLSELDVHKYNTNKKIASRVKKILPCIESLNGEEKHSKFSLLCLQERPSNETFNNYHLNKQDSDDCILASIIEFKSKFPNNCIFYISNDVGPRLKAQSLNIAVIKPSSNLQMPFIQSEEEIENKVLKKELEALKNRQPKLKLTFDDEALFKTFKIKKLTDTEEEFVDRNMQKQKEENTYLIYEPPAKLEPDNRKTLQELIALNLFPLKKEQVDEYNNELDTYFKAYENFLRSAYNFIFYERNTIGFKVYLHNTGTLPANDIDIDLHIPDGFDVITDRDFPHISEQPSPPYKPKNSMDLGGVKSLLRPQMSFPRNKLKASDIVLENTGNFNIKRTNSYDVSYHVRYIKHQQNKVSPTLLLKFDDIDKAIGFTIDYKIVSADVPNAITGKLEVTFE